MMCSCDLEYESVYVLQCVAVYCVVCILNCGVVWCVWHTGVVGHVVDAVGDVSESLRAVVHTVECCHVSCREERKSWERRKGER
jgi:hypothetical protein